MLCLNGFIIAKKDIFADNEILVNYGDRYWENEENKHKLRE